MSNLPLTTRLIFHTVTNMRIALKVLGLGCAVLLSGCGSKQPPPPAKVYPVSGKVTYKGEPLVGADLTFFNEESNRSAFGRTNDRGEYKLTTFSPNDGAVPGKHLVTIVKIEPPPQVKEAPVDSPEYVPPAAGQSTTPPPKSVFPEKYGDRTTSGLVAIVNESADNVVNFDLTD